MPSRWSKVLRMEALRFWTHVAGLCPRPSAPEGVDDDLHSGPPALVLAGFLSPEGLTHTLVLWRVNGDNSAPKIK